MIDPDEYHFLYQYMRDFASNCVWGLILSIALHPTQEYFPHSIHE